MFGTNFGRYLVAKASVITSMEMLANAVVFGSSLPWSASHTTVIPSWSTSISPVLLPLDFLGCWGFLDVWPLSAFCDLQHLVFYCPLFLHPWHVASLAGQLSCPEECLVQLPHCPFGCWHLLPAVFCTALTFFSESPICQFSVEGTMCLTDGKHFTGEEFLDKVGINECTH